VSELGQGLAAERVSTAGAQACSRATTRGWRSCARTPRGRATSTASLAGAAGQPPAPSCWPAYGISMYRPTLRMPAPCVTEHSSGRGGGVPRRRTRSNVCERYPCWLCLAAGGTGQTLGQPGNAWPQGQPEEPGRHAQGQGRRRARGAAALLQVRPRLPPPLRAR